MNEFLLGYPFILDLPCEIFSLVKIPLNEFVRILENFHFQKSTIFSYFSSLRLFKITSIVLPS